MPTTNMALTLPTVSVTVGPTYATQVNTALETVDAHDHSSGKGVRIGAAGISVDGNLSLNGYSLTSIKATTYTQQASAIATANSAWFKSDGNFWVTNGSGAAIQITSGGTLNTSALITSVYSQLALAGNLTIASTDTYTHYKVDASAARSITLPAASAVGAGRYYIFSDSTGTANTNNITINRAGSDTIDGATSVALTHAYGALQLVSDGTSAWAVIGEQDATSTHKGRLRLTGDLGGTSTTPTVVGLTGSSGVVNFGAAVSGPTIGQADASGIPVNLTVRAQGAGGANNGGGYLLLNGGAATGSGKPGGVRLLSSIGTVGVEAGAFSGTRRFVAFHANPASTDIPTGDLVIYIANASTLPSSNPVGGGVLYVDAGALKYRGPGGTITTIAAS